MSLAAGARVGPFEIEARLDLPALGEVYRAHDHDRGRPVALQVVRAEFGRDPDLRERFERDMRAAASFSHPHVAEIYDVGIDASAAYVVSEPLDGATLRARLDRVGPDRHSAASWLAAARARLALRRQGIVHPGLRAELILLAVDGRVLLLGGGLRTAASVPASDTGHPLWRRGRAIAAGTMVLGALAVSVLLFLPRDRQSMAAAAPDATPPTAAPAIVAPVPAQPEMQPVVSPEPLPIEPLPIEPAPAAPATLPAGEPEAPRRLVELPPKPAAAPVPPPSAPAVRPSAAEPPRPAVDPAMAAGRGVSRRMPSVEGRDTAALVTEANVLSTEFDLEGAQYLLNAAAGRGDAAAQTASLYVGGIMAARQSFLQGGSADSLTPVHDAITALAAISRGRPGPAEIARLMLQAAAAAAQSEREEMRLYIETAMQMESVQQSAGFEGAPLIPAGELAGELWLQVHRYAEAQQAFKDAAARRGANLRILAGLARTARRLGDAPGACAAYRTLTEAWSRRPALPVEIAEARAYLGGCAQ